MSSPLFEVQYRGPLRVAFDRAADGGPDTLRLLGAMQADRLDTMRATNSYRGLVPLSAEFRATLRDLAELGSATDPLEALVREFAAADRDRAAGGHGA